MKGNTPRRGFLESIAAATLGVAALPDAAVAGMSEAAQPDESWLKGLTGKHRQIFDVSAMRGGQPLGRAMNFLDAYAEAYHITDADVNVVFGVHGSALPLVLSDAFWAKYELGKHNSETDPTTRAPAVRNLWARGGAASVARLQERGVRFIACHRSIRRLAGELAPGAGDVERVRLEIIASLLPKVTAVPAMIVAVNRAQEEGLSYAAM